MSEKPAGGFAIFLMDGDGTNKIEITTLNVSAEGRCYSCKLTWSPRGGRIAFSEFRDIFVINIDGTDRQNLTNFPYGIVGEEPSWSPDGSRILFSSNQTYFESNLFAVNSDGTQLHAIADADNWEDYSPTWSPSGDKIAFIVSKLDYNFVIYTANADGTDRHFFDGCTNLQCRLYSGTPVWSPDGSKIVFHTADYFGHDTEIYAKNLDGTGFAQLTDTNGSNFNPSWQPLNPTVSIAGRVTTANGRGVGNVVVFIADFHGGTQTVRTSSFGYYTFTDVPTGTYSIAVRSKSNNFQPQTLSIYDNVAGVDFTALQ